jgi:hypothetical protein
MASEQLAFPGMPAPVQGAGTSAGKKADLSEDARRTVRQRQATDRGTHPLGLALTRPLPQHPDAADTGRTCGNCQFRAVIWTGSKSNHPKCVIDKGPPAARGYDNPEHLPRVTRGAATDVRKWWPGCIDHEFGDNSVSPDAARSGPATAYADDDQ